MPQLREPARLWNQLAGEKYISVETYRKNGTPVRTPMWFAADPDNGSLYLSTPAKAGKVKRIRANPRARVAASDFQGNPKGEWLTAEARFCDPQQAKRAGRLLDRKYPLKFFFNVAAFLFRRKRAVIALIPAEGN
jgi:PPOX class probable F420-dependent enzyme